jgi:uncharacterized protein YgbK (DUF1537 family)
MIAVIADDFSGAAEITGIAWRYGLRAVLQTDVDLSVNYDIVVIDTDTRSKTKNEARQIYKLIAHTLNQSKIDWLYKKTDSVLRGHIIAEIESLAIESKINKILIVANNPSVGKVIKKNNYYVGDRKLHETNFRFDPEFPLKSSVVTDILGLSEILPLTYIEKTDTISGTGIFIPEITTLEDLSRRVSEIDEEILPVGGSDFFKSLLEAKGYKSIKREEIEKKNQRRKRFFVFASTAEQSRKMCLFLQKEKVPVCNLPCETADISNLTDNCLQRWVDNIKISFDENNTVLSAVMHPVNRESGFPQALNKFISQMIKEVLEIIELDELIIEGGGTTSQLVRSLGWRNFTPLREYSTGVVKLISDEKPGCKLIVKPGSYSWPEHFLPVDIA